MYGRGRELPRCVWEGKRELPKSVWERKKKLQKSVWGRKRELPTSVLEKKKVALERVGEGERELHKSGVNRSTKNDST